MSGPEEGQPAAPFESPHLADPAETSTPQLPPPGAPPAPDDSRLERLREPVVTVPPVVVVVETRGEQDPAGRGARRRIARGNETVAMTASRAAGDEWWFERNPVDPCQFSAVQVDRGARVLLLHGCSDLVQRGVARSFPELLQLGVTARDLAALVPDGRSEEAFGIVFEHRVAAAAAAGPIREVWWNEAWKLPLRVVRSSGRRSEVQEIVELQREVDAAELADPRRRLPDFEVWESVDWLEKLEHHAHGDDARHELATSPEAVDAERNEDEDRDDEEREDETVAPRPPSSGTHGSSGAHDHRDGIPFPPRPEPRAGD